MSQNRIVSLRAARAAKAAEGADERAAKAAGCAAERAAKAAEGADERTAKAAGCAAERTAKAAGCAAARAAKAAGCAAARAAKAAEGADERTAKAAEGADERIWGAGFVNPVDPMSLLGNCSHYLYIPPPKNGYADRIASELCVHKLTVLRALRLQSFSRKAEIIRRLYFTYYIKPYLPA